MQDSTRVGVAQGGRGGGGPLAGVTTGKGKRVRQGEEVALAAPSPPGQLHGRWASHKWSGKLFI